MTMKRPEINDFQFWEIATMKNVVKRYGDQIILNNLNIETPRQWKYL